MNLLLWQADGTPVANNPLSSKGGPLILSQVLLYNIIIMSPTLKVIIWSQTK